MQMMSVSVMFFIVWTKVSIGKNLSEIKGKFSIKHVVTSIIRRDSQDFNNQYSEYLDEFP